MTRPKQILPPEITDIIMSSELPASHITGDTGLTVSRINKYRLEHGYKIKHKPGGCAIRGNVELASVDHNNPADLFLYGAR